MINYFLKAKSWQIFILTFGIPVIFQIVFMSSIVYGFLESAAPDPEKFMFFMKFMPLLILLYSGILFGWIWSLGVGLQNKVPSNIKLKVKKFKVFFTITMMYIGIVSILLFYLINAMPVIDIDPNPVVFGGFIGVFIPVHLFSMFCIFYAMYFVSKTIKTVELQRDVEFGDFAGEFFLIWFYPIGVWFIQPKINKLAH
jgi:hypothetical protein